MHDAIALRLAMPTILRGIVGNLRGLATSVHIHRGGVVVQVCGLAQDLEVLGRHRVALVREVAPCCRRSWPWHPRSLWMRRAIQVGIGALCGLALYRLILCLLAVSLALALLLPFIIIIARLLALLGPIQGVQNI
jgi:hypothetical protein